jgi:hypothetical protein
MDEPAFGQLYLNSRRACRSILRRLNACRLWKKYRRCFFRDRLTSRAVTTLNRTGWYFFMIRCVRFSQQNGSSLICISARRPACCEFRLVIRRLPGPQRYFGRQPGLCRQLLFFSRGSCLQFWFAARLRRLIRWLL